ncbi:MAG: methane monooxygenase/ammonia monooxygenase subunit A, partial [Actinomycetota bacterium]
SAFFSGFVSIIIYFLWHFFGRWFAKTDFISDSDLYTDGVCPLDGWKPEGLEFRRPLAARVDWFWPSMIFMAVASIAMGVLVLLAYSH